MENLNILIVDDSPTMRRILINTLKRAGFSNVTEVASGIDALRKMREQNFQLVITDWYMEEIDGLGLIIRMKDEESLKSIPVIGVFKRNEREEIESGKKYGMANYIVKPYTPEVLLSKIKQVFE